MSEAGTRLFLAILAAMIGIGVYFYTDTITADYFQTNRQIREKIRSLNTDLRAVEGEILRSKSFLYHNYDMLHFYMRSLQRRIDRLIQEFDSRAHFYTDSYAQIFKIRNEYRLYKEEITRFLTLNSSIKNSVTYIPHLQLKAFELFDESRPDSRDSLLLMAKITATVSLVFNTMDRDFFPELHSQISKLKHQIELIRNPDRKRLLQTLESHLTLFEKYYPSYQKLLRRIIQTPLKKEIHNLDRIYQKESEEEFADISNTNRLLLVLYLISLIIIIYYIVKTQQENRRLEKLKSRLEQILVTDELTSLGNRQAFQLAKRKMQRPALILINVDRFKHINEFYGSHIGDTALRKIASELQRVTPASLHATCYRLGGDDFGILFEIRISERELESLLLYYFETLESHKIEVEGLEIDLSYTIGASSEKNRLFETADMALRSARNSATHPYLIYSREIDKRREIARNIKSIRQLRKALTQNQLLPYYQPIVSLQRKERQIKFEALARIEVDEGRTVLKPESFIPVAKEARLSGKISREILEKTLRIARQHPYYFSINLTVKDIESHEIRNELLQMLLRYENQAHQLIIEILESEEIENYETVNEFINQVKRLGTQIAIDDFGSGYSNFEKILKMDIDLLKIDGSLIKRIDHDLHSELIVKTILDFAKYAGIETVAEFVHSQAVYRKVQEMGFDYAQGNYIGKAKRNISDILSTLPHEK